MDDARPVGCRSEKAAATVISDKVVISYMPVPDLTTTVALGMQFCTPLITAQEADRTVINKLNHNSSSSSSSNANDGSTA